MIKKLKCIFGFVAGMALLCPQHVHSGYAWQTFNKPVGNGESWGLSAFITLYLGFMVGCVGSAARGVRRGEDIATAAFISAVLSAAFLSKPLRKMAFGNNMPEAWTADVCTKLDTLQDDIDVLKDAVQRDAGYGGLGLKITSVEAGLVEVSRALAVLSSGSFWVSKFVLDEVADLKSEVEELLELVELVSKRRECGEHLEALNQLLKNLNTPTFMQGEGAKNKDCWLLRADNTPYDSKVLDAKLRAAQGECAALKQKFEELLATYEQFLTPWKKFLLEKKIESVDVLQERCSARIIALPSKI